jgi:Flp pilus assembly protein TadD
MKKTTIAVALATSCIMLAGCQQMGSMFAARPASAERASVDMSSYFAERLEAGRRELMQHRPSRAVVAFRQASYDPASAAEAYNGMAVAYAQIGREDLARGYFMAALQADPSDERYVRNLARLDRGHAADSQAQALAAAPAPAAAPLSAPARAEQPSALVRVSNREVTLARPAEEAQRPNEVRISTSPRSSTASPTARVTVERPAARRQSPEYPVRVVFADVPLRPQPQYPVRIELPQSR